MSTLQTIAETIIQWSALLALLAVGLVLAALVVMYIIDVRQTRHTIRRNYPVIGRFRYWFEHLGEFFRQYFFAMDREEMPFNRAERAWVYRAAKNVDTTIAFGSTRPLTQAGEPLFLNSPFPILDQHAAPAKDIHFGKGYCREPYTTNSIINISAMSFGSISKPAIQALSRGAQQAGIWLNTGEGGLSPYHLEGGCDIVFQFGTAKYGVRQSDGHLCDTRLKDIAAHQSVRMFEIKMSQGAKPGKGGILPGAKVTSEIAKIRGIPQGEDSISPNGHPDIRSVEEILTQVQQVRNISGKPVGIKLVVGQSAFLHDLFKAIHQQGLHSAPDFITIDSADGGTGAAPQPLMDYVGLPLSESLPLVVNLLHEYGLRERIKVIASGKLITPGKVAWALSCGADVCVSARGFMFALGCIQALQCHKNTCPTGITTHNADLQRGLVPTDKAQRVAAYAKKITYGVGLIAHACGVSEARGLQRQHVRLIEHGGESRPMNESHPVPPTRPEYRTPPHQAQP